MRLISFSVQKYRSIIKAERLQLGDLTVLVGPNNEGKSNILQALVTGMRYLARPTPTPNRVGRGIRRRGDQARSEGRYEWERDYPQTLQQRQPSGRSIFDFLFRMTEEENKEFETRIGHRLNQDLPVRLLFGEAAEPEFGIRKQRSGPTISEKKAEIRAFVAERVQVQYIPAVRTARTALDVVEDMVRSEIAERAAVEDYAEAVARLQELEKPIVEALAAALGSSLGELLPEVKSVRIELEDRGIRPSSEVRLIVDDGIPTDLALKGDGVQSLAAISLIRHYAAETASSEALILAIEEPEAHLHPSAIHALRRVLEDISRKQQVVLTTHSPLLVNRLDLASNIIVQKAKARPATSVRELRDILGVRTADNLEGADVVLLVEGAEDQAALHALLAARSAECEQALSTGALHLQPLFGSGNLNYILTVVRDSLCLTHAFLDDDDAGRMAAEKARSQGLLAVADQTFAGRLGQTNSEIEDLYDSAGYAHAVKAGFNVDCGISVGKSKKLKWSDRMRLCFGAAGQSWDDGIEASLKRTVSATVVASPGVALRTEAEPIMDALVEALQRKLTAARAS
jgi:putative ATP-dependent endonuclease of OLD family